VTSARVILWPAVLYLVVGAGSVVAAGSVLAAGRPTSWRLLVVPAVVLAVALVHAFVEVASRRAGDTSGEVRRRRPVAAVFGVAPRGLLVTAGVVFVSGWVVGVLAMAGSSAGVSRDDGPSACRYYLENHGVRTCVSRDRYVASQAAEQATAFAMLGFFLSSCAALTMGSTPAPAAKDAWSSLHST
jgi:hypothetical protein